MEDGNLISQTSLGLEKRQKLEEVENGSGSAAGFIHNFISNFNGTGGDESSILKAEDGGINLEKEEVKEEERGTKRSGGILDELISNLSSPRTPKPIDVEVFGVNISDSEQDVDTTRGGENGGKAAAGGGGGGKFNDLISNFLHQNEGGANTGDASGEKVKAAASINGGGDEQDGVQEGAPEKTGSMIDNFVSRLPTENDAPGPDEASILIHAVVHD